MKRKLLSGLTALVMLFALAAIPVGATEAPVVAKVGEDTYTDLQAAVDAANGAEVVLQQNVDISTTGLTVTGTVTLDLNGCEIKAANTTAGQIEITGNMTLKDSQKDSDNPGKIVTTTDYSPGWTGASFCMIEAVNGGTFTLESGYINAVRENPGTNGQFAVGAQFGGKVIINGGKIEAGWYAVSGNGTNTGDVTINGGELISTADYAIYHPQKGTLTITGGTIYGAAGGISVNRGTVNISGGEIQSGNSGNTGNWGDGTSGQSNSAINFNAAYDAVNATITGGTFIADGDAIALATGAANQTEISVTGGEFSDESFVTYIPDEYKSSDTGTTTTYKVTPRTENDTDTVASVTVDGKTNCYASLSKAVEAAEQSGGTVKLLTVAHLDKTQEITSDVTIDLNGNDIVGINVRALWVKSGKLTLTGEGHVATDADETDPIDASSSVIRVGDSNENTSSAGLDIGPAVTIDAFDTYGVTVFGTNSALDLTVSGKVFATGPASAISGNGSKGLTATNITIAAGANVSASNTAAIYHPQQGTLTIKDGATVDSGNGAGIVARAGNVVIEGGTVTGSGTGTHIVGDSTVALPKGAVVYDSSANYPGLTAGTNQLTISGGYIGVNGGGNAAAVAAVTPESGESKVAIAVSGGTFSSEIPEEYCADNFHPHANPDGTTYSVHIHTSDEGVVTTEPTADQPGVITYYCTVCGSVVRTENFTGVLEILPTITDTSYTVGTADGAALHCSGALSEFRSVSVDGAVVDSSNYTLKEGSTILTFTKAYLDTLSVGQHSVVLTYSGNRTVPATLTVVAATAAAPQSDHPEIAQAIKDGTWGKPDPTPAPKATPAPAAAQPAARTVRVPQTGDSANPVLWVGVMAAALLGLAGVGIARRRRD